MKVKRWILLTILGLLLIGAGFSILNQTEVLGMIERYIRILAFEIFDTSSSLLAALVVMFIGLCFLIFGFRKTVTSILHAVDPFSKNRLVEIIYEKRQLERGPKIVVIGGGTGIPVLLKGLKSYTTNVTAIVTVADDGGSSGKLRGEFGILPPGDIRNCMVALADKESLMEEVLQYRFSSKTDLGGHNLGNLLIAGMTEITGSFYDAIKMMSTVLAIKGQVIPSTLKQVVLGAEMNDGEIVYGESKIPESKKGIKRVFLEPQDIKAPVEALKAIREAEIIALGPGSLFTSVLPNLLIDDISRELKESKAIKAYVCNVMTQPGETDDYTASRHAREIIKHVGLDCFDYVVLNKQEIPRELRRKYKQEGSSPVKVDIRKLEKLGLTPIEADVVLEGDMVRHDPEKLAEVILNLLIEERGKGKKKKYIDLLLRSIVFFKKAKSNSK